MLNYLTKNTNTTVCRIVNLQKTENFTSITTTDKQQDTTDVNTKISLLIAYLALRQPGRTEWRESCAGGKFALWHLPPSPLPYPRHTPGKGRIGSMAKPSFGGVGEKKIGAE